MSRGHDWCYKKLKHTSRLSSACNYVKANLSEFYCVAETCAHASIRQKDQLPEHHNDTFMSHQGSVETPGTKQTLQAYTRNIFQTKCFSVNIFFFFTCINS